MRKVNENLYWIGEDDGKINRFENIHPVPQGISYNSYFLDDDKKVLIDGVDWSVTNHFIEELLQLLGGNRLDYCIVSHVEPDHSGAIVCLLNYFPKLKIIASEKAFVLMEQFQILIPLDQRIVIKEGDKMNFGKHEFLFLNAPMVHWPEVIVTYDIQKKILFSADAFGAFKTLNGKLFLSEMVHEDEWLKEVREYYTNIIGKYGVPVQGLLKKISSLPLEMICPLHGPIIDYKIDDYIDKYHLWSLYKPEVNGVLVIYASMYGHTEKVAKKFAESLYKQNIQEFVLYDVAKESISHLISESFKYSHIVLISVTYNTELFPRMSLYLDEIKSRGLQNRKFSLIENGSWSPNALRHMKEKILTLKNTEILQPELTIVSKLKESDEDIIDKMIEEIKHSLNK